MKRNTIICALAVALAVLLFIATNSAAALVLAVLMGIAPITSVVVGAFGAARTEMTFELAPSCVAGQALEMRISVARPVLLRSQIELVFECRNNLTGEVSELPVSLAPSSLKTDTYLLEVPTTACGQVNLKVKSARALDPLGFSAPFVRGAVFSTSYTVYPQLVDFDIDAAHAAHYSFTGLAYDHYKAGQDQSEVFEMREFHDGDSLKSVHWKVSARLDDLVVREASHPMDYDIVLLSGIHSYALASEGQREVMNACLAMFASVSLALVRKGLGHAVTLFSGSGLETHYVDSMASFNAMLEVMMATPLASRAAEDAPGSESDLASVLAGFEQVSKSVLVCDAIVDAVVERLAVSTDLTVLHVSADGRAGVESQGSYLLTHIPAADVYTRVKSLEL